MWFMRNIYKEEFIRIIHGQYWRKKNVVVEILDSFQWRSYVGQEGITRFGMLGLHTIDFGKLVISIMEDVNRTSLEDHTQHKNGYS